MLLLVCLNLAMLPCAMAVEKDHDCPSCPPDHQQEIASHHAHDVDGDVANCVTAQPDCCELDQVSLDDRSQSVEKKSGENTAFVVAPSLAELRSPAMQYERRSTGPPGLVRGSPRLHVINCVYLD